MNDEGLSNEELYARRPMLPAPWTDLVEISIFCARDQRHTVHKVCHHGEEAIFTCDCGRFLKFPTSISYSELHNLIEEHNVSAAQQKPVSAPTVEESAARYRREAAAAWVDPYAHMTVGTEYYVQLSDDFVDGYFAARFLGWKSEDDDPAPNLMFTKLGRDYAYAVFDNGVLLRTSGGWRATPATVEPLWRGILRILRFRTGAGLR